MWFSVDILVSYTDWHGDFLWKQKAVVLLGVCFHQSIVHSGCLSVLDSLLPLFKMFVVCPTEGTQQWCEQSQQPTVGTPFQTDAAADGLWAKLQWHFPISAGKEPEGQLGYSHLPHQVSCLLLFCHYWSIWQTNVFYFTASFFHLMCYKRLEKKVSVWAPQI